MSRKFIRSNAGARRHPARIACGIVGTLLATIVGVMFTVTTADAHHPEVTASIDCRGVVSFTSTAWSTTDLNRRVNSSIGVSYSINGGASFTGLPSNPAYRYDAANNYSFSDTFQLASPLPASVIVKVKALAGWGALGNLGGAGEARQTLALTRPSCPAAPNATVSDIDCAENGASVTLANGGEDAVSFTVRKNNQVIDTVTVAGGTTVDKAYAVGEDETVTFKVSAPGMDDVTRTLTRNCEKPHAGVSMSCGTGAHVTLSNEGDARTTFIVHKGQTEIDRVNVAGHGDATRAYAMEEGETATFTISSTGGMSDIVETVTYDCQRPSASVSAVDCGESGTTVTLTNDGELPVTFTVRKADAAFDTVAVEGGTSVTRTYAVDEDETATFTISAPGMDDVTREVARDCERPSADIAAACSESGAVVTFANDGASTTTFAVRKDGDVIDTLEVDNGATEERTYELDEDEKATFTVSSTGGMDDVEATVERDCEESPKPPVTTPPVTTRETQSETAKTEVLGAGVSAEDEESLPRTGGDPMLLAGVGFGLLLLGGVLVRRNRTSNV